MDGLRHAVHSAYVKVAEAALAPLSQSKFEEKRVSSWRARPPPRRTGGIV
jgi:hypothetical protein